jgi:hypothetical protein
VTDGGVLREGYKPRWSPPNRPFEHFISGLLQTRSSSRGCGNCGKLGAVLFAEFSKNWVDNKTSAPHVSTVPTALTCKFRPAISFYDLQEFHFMTDKFHKVKSAYNWNQ